MSYLAVNEMAADDAAGAEALVRTLAPGLAEARWRALIGRPRPAGALVLRSPTGSVFGFASYRPARDEEGRAVLVVDNFVTAELSRRGRGRELLGQALADRAAILGCSAVRQLAGQGRAWHNALALADAR
jgi:hypothetical protein